MRGDRPRSRFVRRVGIQFTPHARGSTYLQGQQVFAFAVYPACAGIDRPQTRLLPRPSSLPRMRGDRPIHQSLHSLRLWFTPHARGSTVYFPSQHRKGAVYPACAGIDLTQIQQ